MREFAMSHVSLLQATAHVGLSLLVGYALYRVGWQPASHNVEECRKVVEHGRSTKLVGCIGVAIGLFFIWVALVYPKLGKDGWEAAALAIGAGAFLLLVAARVRMEWNHVRLVGYRLMGGPVTIMWQEVERIYIGIDGSVIVRAKDGRKIELSQSQVWFQEWLSEIHARMPSDKVDAQVMRLRRFHPS